MNFEEKLKKQLTKKLDKDVPNPYAKKGFFSLPLPPGRNRGVR